MSTEPQVPFNRFRNNAKVIDLGANAFAKGEAAGVMKQVVDLGPDGRWVTKDGHAFVNFSNCDYLGLHRHPKVIQGAIDAIREQGFFGMSLSNVRVGCTIHQDVEKTLGNLFDCRLILALSCSAASEGILPVVASGRLTNDVKPLMIFDRHSHFSMAVMTPSCGDETQTVTCKHNDLNFIEDMCKKHKQVAYVGDGTYSMGGQTMLDELRVLQDKYGLFAYLDDSHSLSLYGKNGRGFVRDNLSGPLNERTIIVASMAKAFGAAGGLVMHNFDMETEDLVRRFGGPLGWSQNLGTPCMGAALGSAAVHGSPEITSLQNTLKERLALFDSLIETPQKGALSPIRMVTLGEEDTAVAFSSELYKRGFYVSAVFFPIVARGKAGIRVMLHAIDTPDQVRALCSAIDELKENFGVTAPTGVAS